MSGLDGAANGGWQHAPIDPTWIVHGDPVAEVMPVDSGRQLSTGYWRCAAGGFVWRYDSDEAVVVLSGGMLLRDVALDAPWRPVTAGESVLFKAGTSVEWNVPDRVYKHYAIYHGRPLWRRALSRARRALP